MSNIRKNYVITTIFYAESVEVEGSIRAGDTQKIEKIGRVSEKNAQKMVCDLGENVVYLGKKETDVSKQMSLELFHEHADLVEEETAAL